MNEGYCVLIGKPEIPDLKKLADALEEFHRIPEDDAIRMARKAWGFAGEHLTEERACLLAGKCREAGIETVVLDSALLAKFPAEKNFTQAVVKPEGFKYTLETKEPGFVSWENLLLASAAPVKEEIITTQIIQDGPSGSQKMINMGIMAVTGLPLGFGKKNETKKETRIFEFYFYLELFFSAPPYRIRMRNDLFDYSYLAGRKEYSSQLNFRNFIDDLRVAAPDAIVNTGFRAIQDKKPLQFLAYASLDCLEKESRWLLTITGQRAT